MKRSLNFWYWGISCLFSLGVSFADVGSSLSTRLIRADGTVLSPVPSGIQLQSGDRLITGNSPSFLVVVNGTVMKVTANTEFVVSTQVSNGKEEAVVTLTHGQVATLPAQVTEARAGTSTIIVTPAGTLPLDSLKQTSTVIQVSSDSKVTTVTGLSGNASFVPASGETMAVGSGEKVTFGLQDSQGSQGSGGRSPASSSTPQVSMYFPPVNPPSLANAADSQFNVPSQSSFEPSRTEPPVAKPDVPTVPVVRPPVYSGPGTVNVSVRVK